MAANGDDLKHFYAERIGDSTVLNVGTAFITDVGTVDVVITRISADG